MVGMAIAGGISAVASAGVGIYGGIKKNRHNERMSELQRKQNEVNYESNKKLLDQAGDSLDQSYNQSVAKSNQLYGQNVGIANRQISQGRDQANITRKMASDSFDLESDKAFQSSENRVQGIADLNSQNSKKLSSSVASSASSGVRQSGTLESNLDLQKSDLDRNRDLALIGAKNNIDNFIKGADLYFDKADEAQRQGLQAASNAQVKLNNYKDNFKMQMGQMKDSYDLKKEHLSQKRTILTNKYNAGDAIQAENANYVKDMAWTNIAAPILQGINTGVGVYQNYKQMKF